MFPVGRTRLLSLLVLPLFIGCNEGRPSAGPDTGTPGPDTGTPGPDTGTPGPDAGQSTCPALTGSTVSHAHDVTADESWAGDGTLHTIDFGITVRPGATLT